MDLQSHINYLSAECANPTYSLNHQGGKGSPIYPPFDQRAISVRNARDLSGGVSLDEEGFSLHRIQSGNIDLYHKDSVKKEFYPLLEDLVKGVTSARRVKCFQHFTRNTSLADAGNNGTRRETIKFIHCDYGNQYANIIICSCLKKNSIEELPANSAQIINAWMPIRGPLTSMPLALCDSRSVNNEERVTVPITDYFPGGELQTLRYSPNHDWYFYPNMNRDEVILFKQHDTNDNQTARGCMHAAIPDNSFVGPSITRESIEVRILVLY